MVPVVALLNDLVAVQTETFQFNHHGVIIQERVQEDKGESLHCSAHCQSRRNGQLRIRH